MKALETVTVETGPKPSFTIIWMHGLGADGHDFEPLVPELLNGEMPALRFVFPHAPVRPVTINNGYPMRAWYDIIGIDRRSTEDFKGMGESADAIGGLIHREHARGITSDHILLAGFSQGGAMALHLATRHPDKFAGVIALSCYLPLAQELREIAERHEPAYARSSWRMARRIRWCLTRSGMIRGSCSAARATPSTGTAIPCPMRLCEPEVADLRAWLARTLVGS